MALKPCKECGAPVSEKAESCPMCGAKQPKKTSKLALVLAGLILFSIFMGLMGRESSTTNTPESSESKENKAGVMLFYTQQMIKKNAKDPSSVEFRGEKIINESEDGAVACAQYNAKNSFGAYVGYKSFVAVESTQKVYYENSENHKEFVKYWNKHCV